MKRSQSNEYSSDKTAIWSTEDNKIQFSKIYGELEENNILDDLENILIHKVQGYENLWALVRNIDNSINSNKNILLEKLHSRIKYDCDSLVDKHGNREYLERPIKCINSILEEIENYILHESHS